MEDAQSRFADPVETADTAHDVTIPYHLLGSTEDGEVGVEMEEQEDKITWVQREKRRVGIDRQSKVQMEVLMRPEVRPDIIALGVAHGMAGQKYIEHLIVNAINENPDLVIKGEEYIKRAKGSIRRAIALAQQDMADHRYEQEFKPSPSRNR